MKRLKIFFVIILVSVSVSNAYAGDLSSFSYFANSHVANTSTDYTFNFTNETAISSGSLVAYFGFDGAFNLNNSTSTVLVNGVPRNVVSSTYLNNEAWIYIDSDIATSSTIEIILHNVTNPLYSGSYNFSAINNDLDSVSTIDPDVITLSGDGSINNWNISTLDTSASISWSADPAITNATVQYSTSGSYGLSATTSPSWSASLIGLTPSTTYNFRVIMNDGNGHYATSTNQTFQTLSPFFAGGDGSSGNPFQISTCSELQNISAMSGIFSDQNFILIKDIDCAEDTHIGGSLWNDSAGFIPIGIDSHFSGNFDGQGHTISNLFIDSGDQFVGLFSDVVGGSITGVGLVDADVHSSNALATGILVGYNEQGRITKSYSTGNVIGSVDTGGLVGYNYNGHIEDTYSSANVQGTNSVGGLVGSASHYGYPFPDSIVNSYAAGNVTGEESVGGLVGNINNDPVSNSFSTAVVTSPGLSVGGLIGNINDNNGNYLDLISNLGWLGRPDGPANAVGTVGSTGTSTNVTYNIKSGGGDGFIDGDQSWFFDKTKDIYNTTLNSEPIWDFATPVWYGYTDKYPDFVSPVVVTVTPPSPTPPPTIYYGSGIPLPILQSMSERTKQEITNAFNKAHGISSSVLPFGGSWATSTLIFNTDLTLGSKGNQVLLLQRYLNNHGFPVALAGVGSVGNETNYFGIATKNALIKFQKSKNIKPAVGYFGPATRNYINSH